MDAVELEYPVDVPKFMGSDGFGRASVTVNEVVACESNTRGVSIIAKSSIERCSTFLRQKGLNFQLLIFAVVFGFCDLT